MPKRTIPTPFQQGSRTPEEIREAVKKVMAERDAAAWEKVLWSPAPEDSETDPLSNPQQTSSPLTDPHLGAKLLPVKSRKRVLLEPATVSPKRALIQAAVERVAVEREHRVAAEKAAAKVRASRPSGPISEG